MYNEIFWSSLSIEIKYQIYKPLSSKKLAKVILHEGAFTVTFVSYVVQSCSQALMINS